MLRGELPGEPADVEAIGSRAQTHAAAEQRAAQAGGWSCPVYVDLTSPDAVAQLLDVIALYESNGYEVVLKSAPSKTRRVNVWVRRREVTA